ncbi:3-oxoacyl-[acyl-carrier-protein] reductase [candidate division WOR-1 bacterium RIFOXYD2_FULL_36_8]|uniref:3-oxoacyl-[acyl-carrier-protein] reductase n=1 Tax=candidate division WOR-1 bacterium RIFOXYB2_FULL_36_35 TaxID=1802578 RepID=A0A1F4S417_UNCSA|nr:MAG: 3-oxoacyl-[acyl-carrier-protein] reductase [candidate division WOR-1 bacterium RIFOXYA2_FULL_36_21]OGC15174.1 MAG: 3-oxoacyl-[acyl-carrier-protein] reductase [candidate division WOR-1 bacterium RIFOXYB2_FULL_36_35]OGC19034.1 MAG: 3-oxoacyl-[acyl-carrier-protein] reductase [candidate division WOR-1 bacterium RIFOXYA12_FULL_36_13]OGC37685.1 MAG: 3-oxoacyl-[acyl-carrier-protein] reductase [candidate division WOR-1 bacterium RIFOXYD2_FULL_36_8]
MKLKDKVAFVTGAAQGIGKSIAEALAREGADIIVSDINLELAVQTAAEIEKIGVKTMALKTNVSDFCDVENGVEQSVKQMGKIDILVNNAGITRDTLLMRMKKEDWDAVINVNLTGVFNCTKIISALMIKQRSGKIVSIASIVGEMGNVGQTNYAAAKAGVIGMTKTVARELASRGICVNAVAPGFIQTAMTDKLSEDVKNKMVEVIPLKRMGTPTEVAKAVLFLAGPDSDYITGQIINVNGGMLMNT